MAQIPPKLGVIPVGGCGTNLCSTLEETGIPGKISADVEPDPEPFPRRLSVRRFGVAPQKDSATLNTCRCELQTSCGKPTQDYTNKSTHQIADLQCPGVPIPHETHTGKRQT